MNLMSLTPDQLLLTFSIQPGLLEQTLLSELDSVIAKATAIAKTKLLPWSLRDTIPQGGIIPKDTGFMASTNYWSIANSGFLGQLDIIIHFDTPYAQFVEDKPSKTGSQGFMEKVLPKVSQMIADSIVEAISQNNLIQLVSITV